MRWAVGLSYVAMVTGADHRLLGEWERGNVESALLWAGVALLGCVAMALNLATNIRRRGWRRAQELEWRRAQAEIYEVIGEIDRWRQAREREDAPPG
jgi:hypothetical protein